MPRAKIHISENIGKICRLLISRPPSWKVGDEAEIIAIEKQGDGQIIDLQNGHKKLFCYLSDVEIL